jgi:ABC-2 type transport system permease protein
MSFQLSCRRLLAMLRKESRQILRDPSSFLIAFVLPLVLLVLFGYGINLDTGRTRIGLVLREDGGAAQSLARAFQQSRWFTIVATGPIGPMKDELVAGNLRGIVVIPQDFGRQVATGGGEIQVITDGSFPNMAGFVASYAEGTRANWAEARADEAGERRPAPPLSVVDRFWFNPQLASRYFLVPGAIAVVMAMIGTLLTALVIAREWERGTMEAVLATPIRMGEFIATKVVPYFLLGIGSMGLCTVLAVTVFGVPFRGSVPALLAIGSAFLIPALGQGLFISAVTKNQFVASQIALLLAFLPALMLSGLLYEVSAMPRWVQLVSYALPTRYLIPCLLTVFLAGDDWRLFLPNMVVLLGFGAAFFLGTVLVTRRRVA